MIHDGRPNAGGARGSDPCEKTPLLGATLSSPRRRPPRPAGDALCPSPCLKLSQISRHPARHPPQLNPDSSAGQDVGSLQTPPLLPVHPPPSRPAKSSRISPKSVRGCVLGPFFFVFNPLLSRRRKPVSVLVREQHPLLLSYKRYRCAPARMEHFCLYVPPCDIITFLHLTLLQGMPVSRNTSIPIWWTYTFFARIHGGRCCSNQTSQTPLVRPGPIMPR